MRIKNFENLGIDHKQHPSKLVPGVNEGDTLPITFQEIPKKSIHKKKQRLTTDLHKPKWTDTFSIFTEGKFLFKHMSIASSKKPKKKKNTFKKSQLHYLNVRYF